MMHRCFGTVVAVVLAAGAGQAAAQQQIFLRSGEGTLGGPDAKVRRYASASMNGEYPSGFTEVEFQVARNGPPATIVQRNDAWGVSLPRDASARWISTHATGATVDGASALYAIPFHVDRPVVRHASIELQFMADNRLGGTWNQGVYINGVPLSGDTRGGSFGSPVTITRGDIGPLLRQGENWLYINVTDDGGPAGLIFAATITIPTHRWYVDWTGIWTPDGQTWGSAYRTLQDALAVAHDRDEIWVARGTYKPTTTGDREASFRLKPGMRVYGGFDGTNHDFNLRNPAANPTVLSGDIHEADADAYHVVNALDMTEAFVLDGFTIEGGNADGVGQWQSCGGGLVVSGPAWGGTNRIANCKFLGNRGANGGGAFVIGGRPTEFINCAFSGNTAIFGGALQAQAVVATLKNCTIVNNTGTWSTGGGVAAANQAWVGIQNSILWGNASPEGSVQDRQMARSADSTLTISHSNVQGLSDALLSSGNIRINPLFWDLDGPDNAPGTRDDRFELRYGTPCADAGNNDLLPAEITTDLNGMTRRRDDTGQPDTGWGGAPIVDMGAVELAGSSCRPDFQPDWQLNAADFVAFRNAYLAGDPAADYNRDGLLSAADFSAFRNAFLAGCW